MSKFKPVPLEGEPKRNNRFIVEFPTELGIESFLVQSVTRPKIKINSVEVPYMNTTFNVSGKYVWENIEIAFIDVFGPNTTQQIMNMVLHCKKQKANFIKEELEGNADFRKRILFTFQIKSLDPTGVEVDKWTIDVEELISVDFGNNNYSDDSLQIITVKLKPHSCRLG